LAEIWMAATDRAGVDVAVQRLDSELKRNPLDCGESREGNRRLAFESPLACEFSVDELDHWVRVLTIYSQK